MKKLKLLIIICLSFIKVSTGQTETSINLIPVWKKGDVKRYEITSSYNFVTVVADGIGRSGNTSVKNVTIQIAGIRDSLIDIIWKYDDVRSTVTTSQDDPFKDLMSIWNKDLVVKYTVNDKGMIKSISNYDEISATLNSNTETAVQLWSKNKINEKVNRTKLDTLKLMFLNLCSTKQRMDGTVLSDVYKFHQLYGKSYVTDQITSIADEIFNGKSDDRLEIKLDSIDKINKLYNFKGVLISPSYESMKHIMKYNREINRIYKYKYPENWVYEFIFTMKIIGNMSLNELYKVRMIE